MNDQTTTQAMELGSHNDHASSLREQQTLYADRHERGCPIAHSDAGGYYMLVGHQEVKKAAGS